MKNALLGFLLLSLPYYGYSMNKVTLPNEPNYGYSMDEVTLPNEPNIKLICQSKIQEIHQAHQKKIAQHGIHIPQSRNWEYTIGGIALTNYQLEEKDPKKKVLLLLTQRPHNYNVKFTQEHHKIEVIPAARIQNNYLEPLIKIESRAICSDVSFTQKHHKIEIILPTEIQNDSLDLLTKITPNLKTNIAEEHREAGAILVKHIKKQGNYTVVNSETRKPYPKNIQTTNAINWITTSGLTVDPITKTIYRNNCYDNPQKKPFGAAPEKKHTKIIRHPNKTLPSTHKNPARTRQLDRQ